MIWEQILLWFQYHQTMKFLHVVQCPWICSNVSWFTVYGNLNRICILLLCENCIYLHYVKLVPGAFQVYYSLLLFYICTLLISEDLILKSESCSVVSDPLRPHALYSTWNSPGQNTEVGSLSILQGIFPGQGIKPRSPTLLVDSLLAEPQGNFMILKLQLKIVS